VDGRRSAASVVHRSRPGRRWAGIGAQTRPVIRNALALLAAVSTTAAVASVTAAPTGSPERPVAAPVPATVVTYSAPVPAPFRVVRGFSPPATRYGAGHLGVDLAAAPGRAVAAAADGTVTFAGPVAGRGVVVVAHADGIRTEYEPVTPLVHAGQAVRRGAVLGRLSGHHPGCATSCLHWGARRGAVYLDPLSLLVALGPVRLLPWPGDP
jgi:murein DD-endopeptidase MepM/ murein hydrolase activator NlpD